MAEASFKNRVWEILERPAPGDQLSRLFDVSMVLLILVSVAEVALRTVPSMSEDHRSVLLAIEIGSAVVFTIELLLRLWVADLDRRATSKFPRFAYLRSAYGVVDLLAVVPFYLELLFPEWLSVIAGVLLLRIFKLVRYSTALATLVAVVTEERKALLGAVTIMLVLLLFSSTVIYLVERDSQPGAFGSIPASMWWGIATLTTVGYGDVTPITPLGKLFGAIVTLLGIGMFALPAGILSSGFTKEMKQRRFLRTSGLVSSVPIFQSLGAADVAQISHQLDPLVVQAGRVVVRQGDSASSMFFVADGALEVEAAGHRKRLSTEFFGEIALLEGGSRSATIRTLTRCQLLVLHANDFEELLRNCPQIEAGVRSAARERRARDERHAGAPSDGTD